MDAGRNISKLSLCDLTGSSGEVKGTLLATKFLRIPEEIVLVGNVRFLLSYEAVEESFSIRLEGTGEFEAKCQRCLEPFIFFEKVAISGNLLAGLRKKVTEDEVFYQENGELELVRTIEDEFLLCLPMVPKHEIDNCDFNRIEEIDSELGKRKTPFSILKKLL